MDTIKWVITTAPEIFLLLSIALGTFFGRLQIKGFSIGATACTLVVAVLLGQLGTFVIPPVVKVDLLQPVRLHDRLQIGA